jgi:N-acetylmuramic acid 6-phosphate (MurNAc-6-P) etherase
LNNSIHFDAEVRSIKSCADRSFNLVLNIPEYQIDEAQKLMKMLLDHVAVAIVKANDGKKNNTNKRFD